MRDKQQELVRILKWLSEHNEYFLVSMSDVIKELSIKVDITEYFEMIVRREYVLEDAVKHMNRSTFSPLKAITVRYYF